MDHKNNNFADIVRIEKNVTPIIFYGYLRRGLYVQRPLSSGAIMYRTGKVYRNGIDLIVFRHFQIIFI